MLVPLFATFALLREYPAPSPRLWASEDGRFAVSMAPPTAKVKEARLRAFMVDADNRYRTMWESKLPHVPQRVMVSNDGHVVALDQYPSQYQNISVVIFDDRGRVLASHTMRGLLSVEEIDAAPRTPFRDVRWKKVEAFVSIRNIVETPPVTAPPVVRDVGEVKGIRNEFPVAFVIGLYNGRTIWFDLVTGKPYSWHLPRWQE